MASPLDRHLRLNLLVVLAVAVACALLGWFSQADGSGAYLAVGLLSIIALPVGGLVLLAIILVLLRAGWRIGGEMEGASGSIIARFSALVAAAVLVAIIVYLPPKAVDIHREVLLERNAQRFANAEIRGETRVTLTNGHQITVTPEREGRYYYSLGGLADNHQGFVYDPTGAVAQAQGWADGEAGRFTATDEVRMLFGGDLLACDHMAGGWYYCSFT